MFAKLKDILAVVKESILILLFILLIAFPGCFNQLLVNAGFTEGSVMGFTWKQKALASKEIADSSQALADAAAKQLQLMQQRLDDLSAKVASAARANPSMDLSKISASVDSSKRILASPANLSITTKVASQKRMLNDLFLDPKLK